jgi:endonuclease-3
MVKNSIPLRLLNRIEKTVRKLNPPVEAFEHIIRTTPFRVLVSVLISSRTKDPVTLAASRRLFATADTPEKMAALGETAIAKLIYPVGFYRQKAKNIMEICRRLGQGEEIPDTIEGLTALPGVGRKTANLVLALAFNRPAIAVDTHVFRISRRLEWARGNTPNEVESELAGIFERGQWNRVNRILVGFGQTICKPLNPDCPRCPVNRECPFTFKR